METLKTAFLHYFDKQDADLHYALMEVKRNVRKGNIHALRVSMKRMRAFFQMLNAVDPHFPGKAASRQIKLPFREAGRVRDLQIMRSLAQEHEEFLALPPHSSGQIKKQADEQQLLFEDYLLGFSLAGIRDVCLQARHRLELIGPEDLRAGLRFYFETLFTELAFLWREGLSSRKRLHDLRKKVKETYYNLTTLDQAAPHYALPADMLLGLETLQQSLGNWHDQVIAIHALTNLGDAPAALRRQVRQDERRCLQDIRIILAQNTSLPDQLRQASERLLTEQTQEIC